MTMENDLKAQAAQNVPEGYDPELYRIRHSLAHIMAQAVIEQFPGAKTAIGPPIENGFYYDFDLPAKLGEEDLKGIENRMKEIIRGRHPFSSSGSQCRRGARPVSGTIPTNSNSSMVSRRATMTNTAMRCQTHSKPRSRSIDKTPFSTCVAGRMSRTPATSNTTHSN